MRRDSIFYKLFQQSPTLLFELLTNTPNNAEFYSQETSERASRAIIEMITTIMVYKFENLNRAEVESMLGITLQETRVYREIKEEGREQGREQGRTEEAANLIIRQLTKRFGELSEEARSPISSLPLPVLEDLSEALLDFSSLADLQVWLERVGNSN